MFCYNCGKEIPEGNICPECGTTVIIPAQPEAVVTPAEETVTPAVEAAPVAAPVYKEEPSKSLGVTSAILGVVSLCSLGSFFFASLGCGIAGLICGIKATRASRKIGYVNDFAKLGKVLSIISIAGSILLTILFLAIWCLIMLQNLLFIF